MLGGPSGVFPFGATGGGGSGGNAYIANVRAYGATGDGVTDDSQAFINAIATGYTVEVPKGNYLISQELTLNDGQMIFGYGYDSNIKTVTRGTTVDLNTAYNMLIVGNNCGVYNLRFTGDGKTTYVFPWTTQNGVWVQGSHNIVHNCYFRDLRGTAVFLLSPAVAFISDNLVSDCDVKTCTVGTFTYVNSEFGRFASLVIDTCDVNINEWGANNSFNNSFSLNAVTNGLLFSGNNANSDHTTFTGCHFEHNSQIMIQNLAQSGIFMGCSFLSNNNIYVQESVKVMFLGCMFNAGNITVTATTAKQTQISNCTSLAATSPTISNSGTSAVITQVANLF